MKRILYLTFYYEPDLSACSFRNTPLSKSLAENSDNDDKIHVVATMPNRYQSFTASAPAHEEVGRLSIDRVDVPLHRAGLIDQIKSFKTFFFRALRLTRNENYHLVFASSSKLFTAFLGAYIARTKGIPLYLDIRDIFTDTFNDVIKYKLPVKILLPGLRLIEEFTFSRADHINLVSEGFKAYFSKYPSPNYSFFTNGIDDIFMNVQASRVTEHDGPIVTYAGNIGEGQGLEKIIPQAAQRLPGYIFRVIGDGGTRHLLEKTTRKLGLSNIKIIPPMARQDLLLEYLKADYFFLHLNDYQVFHKVLPSKIFEYAAFDIPVIAGVSGYAAKFIRQHVPNHILFHPGDYEDMVHQLLTFKYKKLKRTAFIKAFSRAAIIKRMTHSIMKYMA